MSTGKTGGELTPEDAPQNWLDELAEEADAEDRRQAGLLGEVREVGGSRVMAIPPGPYAGHVPGPPQIVPDPEKCPDKGTCHHGCADGACFRVLYASPLSGRYPLDQWPRPVFEAAIAMAAKPELAAEPKGVQDVVRGREPGDVEAGNQVIVFRLRSGDVIHAFVDPMTGTLIAENRGSQIAVFPVSPTRIQVM